VNAQSGCMRSRVGFRSRMSRVISVCTRRRCGSWVRQAEADWGRRHDLLSSEEREELKRLRKENQQLRRANEILKDASVFSQRNSTRAGEADPRRHQPRQTSARAAAGAEVLRLQPRGPFSAQLNSAKASARSLMSVAHAWRPARLESRFRFRRRELQLPGHRLILAPLAGRLAAPSTGAHAETKPLPHRLPDRTSAPKRRRS
jgi:transposase-like protein